jgi:hypothetical protein
MNELSKYSLRIIVRLNMNKAESTIGELSRFEVEVPEAYRTGRRRRVYHRQCYAKAYDYAVSKYELEGVKLVHGLYDPMGRQMNIPHAWVELPEDIVFDGVQQRFYQKRGYYEVYRAEKIVEYTPEEAAKTMLEFNYIGDWGNVAARFVAARNNLQFGN